MSLRTRQALETHEKSAADRTVGNPFPSSRYFQIRFEYLHEVLAELKRQLDEANSQIVALHARLDTLTEKSDVDGG